MDHIPFVFADRAKVPCYLGVDVQSEVLQHLLDLQADTLLFVVDEGAEELHGNYFASLSPQCSPCLMGDTGAPDCELLEDSSMAGINVQKIVLPRGDAAKSWAHLTQLMEWAFAAGATKKSVIVAWGGGALLNVAGLFASILYRGTKLVYIPTTLLAMHDVTSSMKTSICFDGRKNNIGSFYAPTAILIDVAFCRTLSKFEMFSGIGELAKNAVLLGGEHAEGLKRVLCKDTVDANNGGSGEEFSLSDDQLLELVRLGVKAKMDIILNDAYEKLGAMIFEYGHTMSHALEKAYGDGTIPHGLGVTYGMLASSHAAERMGIMTKNDRIEHDTLCNLLIRHPDGTERWPLPEPKPALEEVMQIAMRDSKRGITAEKEDEITDVIMRKVGDVLPSATSSLTKFPSEYYVEWLEAQGFQKQGIKQAFILPMKRSLGTMDCACCD